jgi:hypothetical protein
VYSLYLDWFCTLSAIFSHNNSNNNNLQFSIILKNEAIGLESLVHICGTATCIFQDLLQFQKVINWCLTSLGTIGINRGCWIGLCLRLKKNVMANEIAGCGGLIFFSLVISSVLIIYPPWFHELHVCIMAEGNDVNFFIDTNLTN